MVPWDRRRGDRFDGTTSWQKDAGGEGATLDAPEAKEIARTDAWSNALGYRYPDRGRAAFGPPKTAEVGGKPFLVVEATPEGGRAIDLGFDSAGRLVRTAQRRGAETVTTVSEWRRRFRELPIGTNLKLALVRGGAAQTATLVLAAQMPEHGPSK